MQELVSNNTANCTLSCYPPWLRII